MPGEEFPVALERQRALDIAYCDLKDGLWGRTVEQMHADEAKRAHSLISGHTMREVAVLRREVKGIA
jgi:hypothetical protein